MAAPGGDRVRIDAVNVEAAGFELCGKGPHWQKRLHLQEIGFFELSLQAQVEEIEKFLRECLKASSGFIR